MPLLRNGNHLRTARTFAGLTQRQLATESGLHRNSVRYWEGQETRIGGHAVSRMVEALTSHGVSVDDEYSEGQSVAVLRLTIQGASARRPSGLAPDLGDSRSNLVDAGAVTSENS